MSTSTLNKRALTISEAAAYACVSRGILDGWLTKGLLPFEELPGSGSRGYRFLRIRKADLDEFLDTHHNSTTALRTRQTARKAILLPR